MLNPHHEPPFYYGVERNEVETRIIPSTWREGGVGFTWNTDNGISYEVGITTGFDVNKFDDPSSPLRSVHQELSLAHAHDVSYYAAVNYRGIPGLSFGGAFFTATPRKATQNSAPTTRNPISPA